MKYSEIKSPKIKAIIDNLKHQSYTVMTDIQQAFDEATNESEFIEDATNESEFIEDAMANMDNLHTEILEINNQIRLAIMDTDPEEPGTWSGEQSGSIKETIKNCEETISKEEPEKEPRTTLADMVNAISDEITQFKKDNIPLMPPTHDFGDEPKEVQRVNFMISTFDKTTRNHFVAVRPAGDDKTYLGLYLGDSPTIFSGAYNIPEKEIQIYGRTNPLIFIPDLMKVVFGYESWWGQIKDERQLRQITDEDIKNVWYVKALNEMVETKEKSDTP